MKNEFLTLGDFYWFGAIYGDEFNDTMKKDLMFYLDKIPFD